jgi:hypothetical protein
VNHKNDNRETDVFGGFGFRLVNIDGKLYVAVWLTYKYVDRRWLLARFNEADLRSLHMRHFLYHYGHRWFPVQFLGLVGKSIRDAKFVPEGARAATNVHDYTVKDVGLNGPNWIKSLDPDSPAIAYQYPGNKKRRFGAAALCKLMLSTEDSKVKSLHRMSIKPPDDRFNITTKLVGRYFSGARLGNVPIQVSQQALSVRSKVFDVPPQRFGGNRLLSVENNGSTKSIMLRDLPRARMDCLLGQQGGLAVASGFDAQYLLVPQQLPRSIAEDFQTRLQETVIQFVRAQYGMDLILYADKDARTLKQQVDAIRKAIDDAGVTHGHAVLVLPANAKRDLHNYIKRVLHERLQTQCVSAIHLSEFYERLSDKGQTAGYAVPSSRQSRYTNYLRYTALGLLMVNRQWPWVLDRGTHYDAYIGVDVLNNAAAFTFFYKGGRECFVRSHASKQPEKLSRKQMASVICGHLREDLAHSQTPCRSVVVHRDGRTYESEWLGLQDAVRQLVTEKVLLPEVLIGIVEIPKHRTLGIRLATEWHGDHLRNPKIGSWFSLNDREGIVCTTGYPFEFSGTVNPLSVRIARGKLVLKDVLEDVFRMSQLCWPVPDRCMRLPIDIKLCDDFLRSTAGQAEDDEAMYGEVFVGTEEVNFVAVE